MKVDLLISNGVVFGHGPTVSTVAIRDGSIVAVGVDRRDVTATEEIDAGGGLVSPGFHDAHVHPHIGGEILITCDLTGADDVDGYRRLIAAEHGEGWITGGGWSYDAFPGGMPTIDHIDDLTGERPAFLEVSDGHTAWVNSAALRVAGVDADTPDPFDGRIERFPDGRPNGCLQEGAMELVRRAIPPRTRAQHRASVLAGHDHLVSLGVTSWQDAMVTPTVQRAYLDAASAGLLRATVRGALWWDRERGMEQVDELMERRHERSSRFEPATVKIMLDGVCENFTASMLGPYLDADGRATSNRGLDFVDPSDLAGYVTRLHEEGFQVHFHSLGDGAVRSALDAVAAAVAAHGSRDLRHHLAHIQVIDPVDIPRFARLGAVATAQPLWAIHDHAMDVLTVPFLGDRRAAAQYPFGSLVRAGARLAMGSDWSVSSADPLDGLEVAVHRSHPDLAVRPFLPGEALDLRTAWTAYTAGAAYVSHLDHRLGSIAEGMQADLALIEGDPAATGHPAEHSVTHTIIAGEVEYRRVT